jgi:hypothetical protein
MLASARVPRPRLRRRCGYGGSAIRRAAGRGDSPGAPAVHGRRDRDHRQPGFGRSQAFAAIVERAASSYGLPNGYVVGEEAGGALIGGVRYGQGTLYTRNAGTYQVFWQGPSLGLDVGANGNRVMMMVYNLPSVNGIFDRFVGVTARPMSSPARHDGLSKSGIYVVPVVSGSAPRRQFRLHQVHHPQDLEPVLTAADNGAWTAGACGWRTFRLR